jgi:hypothetical protein
MPGSGMDEVNADLAGAIGAGGGLLAQRMAREMR